MRQPISIVGAGLSGLYAAIWFQSKGFQCSVFEKADSVGNNHRALLRFRDRKFSDSIGIPFQQVLVNKSIHNGNWVVSQPTLVDNNRYSFLVSGKYERHSILNMEQNVVRYIAPENLPELMYSRACDLGVEFNFASSFDYKNCGVFPTISTAPIFISMNELGQKLVIATGEFSFRSITIVKVKLKNLNLNQTMYFTGFPEDTHCDMLHRLYRASIVKDELIAEFVDVAGNETKNLDEQIIRIVNFFGIRKEFVDSDFKIYTQPIGKIQPIDESLRKRMLFNLTNQHKVYSLGRFAIWQNILQDDVVQDCEKIYSMIKFNESYDSRANNLNLT